MILKVKFRYDYRVQGSFNIRINITKSPTGLVLQNKK